MTHRFVISLEDTEEQCLRYKNEVMGLFARLGFPNTFNAQFDAIATKSALPPVTPAPQSPQSSPVMPMRTPRPLATMSIRAPSPLGHNKTHAAPSRAPSPPQNPWRQRSPARAAGGHPRQRPANIDKHPILREANLVPVGPAPVPNMTKLALQLNGHPQQCTKNQKPTPTRVTQQTLFAVPRTLSTLGSSSASGSHSTREKRPREEHVSTVDDSDDFSAYSDQEPEKKKTTQTIAHPALQPIRRQPRNEEIEEKQQNEIEQQPRSESPEQQKSFIGVPLLDNCVPRYEKRDDQNVDVHISPELRQKTFFGTIKQFNERRKYFFVNCPEISNAFGKDPLLIPADGNPENYKKHQKITFGITSIKGYAAPVIEWVQVED